MNLINALIDINAAQANEIIAAPGANNHIRIHRLALFNNVATAQNVTLSNGATGMTPAIALPSSIGGGFILADRPVEVPWFVLSANTAFNITLANATAVRGFVQYTLG